jgi:hypothetical protein
MIRLAFYLGGVAAGLAAWRLWQAQKMPGRELPAQDLADMLWYACADYETGS